MKKIFGVLALGLWLIVNPAQACPVESFGGKDLHDVFNRLFYDPQDRHKMSSDIELLNSAFFLPNGRDRNFAEPGDVLRVDLIWSQDIFGHELGYTDGSIYHPLVETGKSTHGRFRESGIHFSVIEEFVFSDTLILGGDAQQRWYADPDLNPLGQKDHFLAFAIEDDALLSVFNRRYGTHYTAASDDLWVIAFESMNLGDADYNDFVAVVSRPAELNPLPVPGTALLMIGGLVSTMGYGLRRRRK
jgi:hypothetical protein